MFMFINQPTENFSARFCDLQKADADVERGARSITHQEKPLLELQRPLGGRREREEKSQSLVGAAHCLDDQGIHRLQGRVLPVDQPMVLDVSGQVLLCKGLVPKEAKKSSHWRRFGMDGGG